MARGRSAWTRQTCDGSGAFHAGGKDYDSQWNTRMRGTGPYAEMMAHRFHMAVKRLEMNLPGKTLSVASFRRPPRTGDQLSLL